MLAWLVVAYAIVVLTAIAAASFVALFIPDGARREMAYRVLKLLVGAAGIGTLVIAVQRLHQLGLLG